MKAFTPIALVFLAAGCVALADHQGRWGCEENSDCEPGETCRYQRNEDRKVCLGLGEARCQSQEDCLDTELCTSNRCQPRSSSPCNTLLDCQTGEICLSNTCAKTPCASRDAPVCGSFGCNLDTGQCRIACSVDEDCNTAYRCGPGKKCDITACSGPGQCGGFPCAAGRCKTSCSGAEPCEKGYQCTGVSCEKCAGSAGSCGGAGGAAGAAGAAGLGGKASGGAGAAGAGSACNPVTQKGCPFPDDSKCTITGNGILQTSCQQPGKLDQGDSCDAPVLGHDECKPGLICAGFGVPGYKASSATGARCQKLCKKSEDCSFSQKCAAFSDDGYGVCVELCPPLEPCGMNGEGTCSGAFVDNENFSSFIACRGAGNTPAGGACPSSAFCGENMSCIFTQQGTPGVCTRLCDQEHTCPEGAFCIDSHGFPCPLGVVCACL